MPLMKKRGISREPCVTATISMGAAPGECSCSPAGLPARLGFALKPGAGLHGVNVLSAIKRVEAAAKFLVKFH
jgi:hypothetical protein